MIQLIERGSSNDVNSDSSSETNIVQTLGNGQRIERHMANELGVKIFRIHRPFEKGGEFCERNFTENDIKVITLFVCEWYSNGCSNTSEFTLLPERLSKMLSGFQEGDEDNLKPMFF